MTSIRESGTHAPRTSAMRSRSANSGRPAAGRTAAGPTATAGRQPAWLRSVLDDPFSDQWLAVSSVALLVGIGLLMALSSSSVYAQANGDSAYYYAIRQVMFLAIGIPGAWILSRMNERTLKPLGWAAIILALLLLLLTFTPLGQNIKGNRNWLLLGPISMQPSEFAKVAMILWGATVLSTKEKLLDQPKHLLFPLLFGALGVCGLVLLQGDLGTGLVIVGILFSILWLIGTPWVVMGMLMGSGLAVVGLLVVSSENRMTRIRLFLNPPDSGDITVSQQPLSAIYALATGGWFGAGLGESKQKWGGLYDGAQNDYVFAVLGEEMGLLGTFLVILLFGLLAWTGLRIAKRSDTIFLRVVSGGVTCWIMLQAMINIAVAMNMIPVIGVPLPFISVGGSALLANLLGAGLLVACARQEPAARRARAARLQPEPAQPRVTTVVQRRRTTGRG